MSSNVTVRTFRAGDEPGILRVLQTVFEPWPQGEIDVAPIDHLYWKLASDPRATRHSTVAEDSGRIIGTRLSLVQQFAVGGRTLLTRQGADIAMLPAYRGQGIYTRMQRFGTANEVPIFDLHLSNTGRPSLFQVDYEMGNRPIANEVRRLVCETSAHESIQASQIVSAAQSGDEVDVLWHEAASQFNFIGVRSAPYINWRYCDIRAGNFVVRQLWEDGRLAGYAVRRDSYGESYLVELLALPVRPDVVIALIDDALAGSVRAGFDRLFCDIPTIHPYRDVMLECRFVEEGRVMPFTARAIHPVDLDISFLSNPETRVHLMLGDTDLV